MSLSRRDQRITLLVVAVGTFMGALDASIVNVSIPAIMKSYNRGIEDVEWVISSYMIAFAALIPLTAWVRDRVGNVRLYCASLALFTFASVLCGIAPNLETLIIARVLQALGGGAINPTGMAMLAEAYSRDERGKALGWWGMVAVLGPALGPTIGGILTETWGWRWIFLVNIPVGIPLLLFGIKFLPRGKGPQAELQRSFEWSSFVALVAAIVALLYAISRLPRTGLGAWDVQLALGVTVLGSGAFIGIWRRTKRAIIDLDLLKIDSYWRSMVVTIARSLALFGTSFLVPLFLQGPRAMSETATGLVLGPGALAIGLMMPVAGRWIPRFGTRQLVVSGLVMVAVYCLMCWTWNETTSIAFLTGSLVLRGVGIAMMVTPISTMAINAVAESKVGMASSMLNLIQQMSGALGVALFSGLYDFFLAGSESTAGFTSAFGKTCLTAAGITALIIPVAMGLPGRVPLVKSTVDHDS